MTNIKIPAIAGVMSKYGVILFHKPFPLSMLNPSQLLHIAPKGRMLLLYAILVSSKKIDSGRWNAQVNFLINGVKVFCTLHHKGVFACSHLVNRL
ncbi:hypothetical protein D3C74_428550 [compost metagenome]